LLKEVKESKKKKYYEMKTHTHNKTTKLRKFLLMKHNRNIPKFSSANKKKFILSEKNEIKEENFKQKYYRQQQSFDFYTNLQ
jgi:hypothetical protein